LAESIGERLEASLGTNVDVNRGRLGDGESFVDRMDALWHAGLTVVLLSTDSIPSRWVRDEWQRALWEEPEESGVAVCCVQTGPCRFPDSIRRRRPTFHFFDATTGDPLADVRRWIISLQTDVVPRTFLPSESPFPANAAYLETMAEALVERCGTYCIEGDSPAGKTDLVCEFVRRFYRDFEDIIWISCTGRGMAGIAADMPAGFESRPCLLVLDGVDDPDVIRVVRRGRASTVITTRLELSLPNTLRLAPEQEASKSVDHELAALLSVCRLDFLIPGMLTELGVAASDLPLLEQQGQVRRCGGWIRDIALREEERWSLELRHASAAASAARQQSGPHLLPDLQLAITRLLHAADDTSLLIELTRRALALCRDHHRLVERSELLEVVLYYAWQSENDVLISAFGADYSNVLEDDGQPEEAALWRARARRSTPGQLAFEFAD
jgi:hypothetical protein